MSTPRTYEQALLCDAERVLTSAQRALGDHSRLAVLEAAASRLGGWSLPRFRELFGDPEVPDNEIAPFAASLAHRLDRLPMHAALAIAALGHAAHSRHQQRTQGAFYTDFRLASFVGEQVAVGLAEDVRIVDLAAGSGVLLVATVLAAAGTDRSRTNELVARSVCAADLDAVALRACRTSLAALCDDLGAVLKLESRLRRQDSLIEGRPGWADVAPDGFDAVVGNPPWEKVKVSRHEFMRANGHDRHYGDDYALDGIDNDALADERARRAAYALAVEARYPTAGHGELDLYKAFLACSLSVLRDGGTCCLLLPAGLIRSQGTQPLRWQLVDSCGLLNLTVIENRARFFAIDTRFKFLLVKAQKGGKPQPIELSHARGDGAAIRRQHTANIERTTLQRIRPDLTMPEVRGDSEWRLALAMHERGLSLDAPESPFRSVIVREVDMTRDRSRFSTVQREGALPLVEGRMIAQHRFGSKAYRSGTGRRAIWDALSPGESTVEPQFFYPANALPSTVLERIHSPRVGFCDVTGQTNERSIIAARIPPNVVCGNKVPTVTFRDDDDEHLSWLFLAIANSLPFDWIARRVLTTSVNYFLLRSLPLPPIAPRTLVANRIAQIAKQLADIDALGRPLSLEERWLVGEWRAEIDARVLTGWGLDVPDLLQMLDDFPLLDRGQPPLPGERRATVTKDLALSWAARLTGAPHGAGERIHAARTIGALPYTPSEYAEAENGGTAPRAHLLAGDPAW